MNIKLQCLAMLLFAASMLAACSGEQSEAPATGSTADAIPDATTDTTTDGEGTSDTMPGDNPFLVESPLYLKYPPFDRIDDSHYLAAFEAGMAEQLAEIEAIVSRQG